MSTRSTISDTLPLAAFTCAAATILFWAGSFPATTVALAAFSPLPLAALRFAIASTVLGAVVIVRRLNSGQASRSTSLPLRDAGWFAGCGLLGIAVYNWLLNTGLQTVNPAAASFMIACQPVFAALVARHLFSEPFGRVAWVGTCLCMIGALLLAQGQPGRLSFGGGAPLVLLAAVCSGSFFALQRPLAARYGPLRSALGALFCGSILLSPWIGQGLAELAAAPRPSVVALVFLGTMPGALAYVTWMVAIRDLGAAKAANLLFFMAPTAALLAVPITGIWPSTMTWIGGAIALTGVGIVHRTKAR